MLPADYILADIAAFSRILIGVPLYPYQVEALRAVIDSVLNRRGREFLLVFPRQSGKNEAIAHLLVYLLTVFQRHGGQIVYGAVGDGLGRGMRRLEERLDTPWTRGRWRRSGRPRRYALGRASVVFISSHPGAAARGETADHLLILDEAQDHDPAHVEAVFTPMRAAHHATAVYLGTVRTTADFLWAKKTELETAEALDGVRRVFLVGPEQVTAANPDYAAFLAEQVRRYGRHHPIVAAEYFLEPLDGAGGLFPPSRLALMRGDHPRQRAPGRARSTSSPSTPPAATRPRPKPARHSTTPAATSPWPPFSGWRMATRPASARSTRRWMCSSIKARATSRARRGRRRWPSGCWPGCATGGPPT